MIRNKKSFIPNLFTTLNIFCGFFALVSIVEDKIVSAAWLITLAGIFDLFDGQLARLTKTNSSFGSEFDSLADVISFGVAPSLLIYKIYFFKFGILGSFISFVPLIFGCIRLARFNVSFRDKKKTHFVGLPIPIAAVSLVSFVIFNYYFWNEMYLTRLLIPHLIFISVLMISKVKYYVLPKLSLQKGKENTFKILCLAIMVTILFVFPNEAYYPIILLYIVWGIVRYVYGQIKRTAQTE